MSAFGSHVTNHISKPNLPQTPQNPHTQPPQFHTPQGISTQDECVGEFPSDGLYNYQSWDLIPMPATSLTVQPLLNTIADCQGGCSAEGRCQYFEYYDGNAAGGKCYFRLGLSNVTQLKMADVGGSWAVPSMPLVFLEVGFWGRGWG